jgi:predicted dienelactone hydrolase
MVWQRTRDLSAALDASLTNPPAGLQPDLARIAVFGVLLGGHSAMGLSGARLSKPAFREYCAASNDELDCGWMRKAGLDFTQIDAALYEQDLSDRRISAKIAIDPALTSAMTSESLAAIFHPVLIVNFGTLDSIPTGLKASAAAAKIPGARYITRPETHHFAFTADCSALG